MILEMFSLNKSEIACGINLLQLYYSYAIITTFQGTAV